MNEDDIQRILKLKSKNPNMPKEVRELTDGLMLEVGKSTAPIISCSTTIKKVLGKEVGDAMIVNSLGGVLILYSDNIDEALNLLEEIRKRIAYLDNRINTQDEENGKQ